jgi:hypothetical protein
MKSRVLPSGSERKFGFAQHGPKLLTPLFGFFQEPETRADDLTDVAIAAALNALPRETFQGRC